MNFSSISRTIGYSLSICISIAVLHLIAPVYSLPVSTPNSVNSSTTDLEKNSETVSILDQLRFSRVRGHSRVEVRDENLKLAGTAAGIRVAGRRKREVTRLRYKDCGKANRSVRFDQLSVKPIPIQIPGILDLRIKANVTRKLPPVVDVKLVLKKKFVDDIWVKMPCFKDYGSCRYKRLKTCTLTQEVFGCPVRRGYHNIDQKFIIPDPDNALYSQMLEGEYKAIVRARHPTTRKELACLVAHFSLENKAAPYERLGEDEAEYDQEFET